MKKIVILTTLLLSGCVGHKPHVDLMLGTQNFDNDRQWEQTDVQTAVGVQMNLAGQDSIGPEAGFVLSEDTSYSDRFTNRRTDSTSSSLKEAYLGLRKNWMLNDHFQAFVGGGVEYVHLDTRVDLTYNSRELTDYDFNYAPYCQGGLNYFFYEKYSVGLLYRRTFMAGNENIFITNPPVDSNTFMITLGYSF